jgi:hypothetical protein
MRSVRVTRSLGPNLSLNADVPRAGLRPRSGPPVSWLRWASGQHPVCFPLAHYELDTSAIARFLDPLKATA